MAGLVAWMALSGCGGTPADSTAVHPPTAKTRVEDESQTPADRHGRDPVIRAVIEDLTDNPREAKKESPNSKE
jgi:hypothetical protein